jgi:nucleoid DNA-binding protein
MNKQKLIHQLVQLQKKRGLSKAAVSEIVKSIFDHMVITLDRKKRFSYPGFGSFIVRKRVRRQARNPKTGEIVTVPTRRTVLFRSSKNVKQIINP